MEACPKRSCGKESSIQRICFVVQVKPEVNERRQREMGEFFVQADEVSPDRAMQPLQEVVHS